VCTSIADAQPNACLNALGCGTPIIGFNVSGVPYVASEEFGTFVEPFDVDALSEAIKNVKKKTSESIMACYQYALNRYGLEAGERKYRELFDKLIENVESVRKV
jgi:glycosyltransferase involved in cell wall biosynthesis